MKTKVSDKGQVTIPKKLRDQLGIRVGDELDFEVEQGRLVAAKVVEQDPLDAVWGTLPPEALDGMSVDEWIDELRGPAVPPLPGRLEP
jgi:AbrB family looped-hinge helix DNA binding protein